MADPKHPRAVIVTAEHADDPVLRKYREGVAQRAAVQAKANRAPIPDLASANAMYKPGADRPMTLGAMAGAQDRLKAPSAPEASQFRPETIAGLQALHAAVQNHPPQERQQMPPEPVTPQIIPQMSDLKPKTPEELRASQLKEKLGELDDLEFDRVLRNIQNDAINNEKAREDIKKRVKPFDLTRVLAEGEFTQEVAIVPDQLVVWYRSISALENQAVRLLLFRMCDEDKRKENIAPEIFGLMQTVCCVARINGNSMPAHFKGEGYNKEFDEDAFKKKFDLFIRYPVPLLHALGTHGYWFEQRTREAFSAESLKNG